MDIEDLSTIEKKRQKFREKYSGMLSNSYLNLALVLTVFLVGGVYSGIKIHWDLLALSLVPLGFIYGEAALYLAHRFQQHRKRKFQEVIFEMHSVWHHGMFSSENMQVESVKDMNMVVLPFFIHGSVLGIIYFPIALIIESYFLSDIGWILMFSIVLHLAWYEVVHTLSHIDNPLILKTLAHHHREHHNPKLMGKYNFGIGTTIFDRVFGTHYRT